MTISKPLKRQAQVNLCFKILSVFIIAIIVYRIEIIGKINGE